MSFIFPNLNINSPMWPVAAMLVGACHHQISLMPLPSPYKSLSVAGSLTLVMKHLVWCNDHIIAVRSRTVATLHALSTYNPSPLPTQPTLGLGWYLFGVAVKDSSCLFVPPSPLLTSFMSPSIQGQSRVDWLAF